jgi:hypothetical protein
MIQMIKLNFAVNAAFMMVSNTLFLDILVLFNSPQLGWNLFFNVLNNIINAASYGAAAFLPVPKEAKHEAFTEVSSSPHIVDTIPKVVYLVRALQRLTKLPWMFIVVSSCRRPGSL